METESRKHENAKLSTGRAISGGKDGEQLFGSTNVERRRLFSEAETTTNTAPTLCMEAVRFDRGQGREEEGASPAEVRFGNCLPLTSN